MSEFISLESGFTALPDDGSLRLDSLLSRKYPVLSRELWKQRIQDGEVLLNGDRVRPSRKLKPGETITFRYTKKAEPEIDRTLDIIYEDASVLLISKRPGIPVHPSGSYFRNTLYFLIKEHYGEEFPVHFVHRLDRETSGLLLLAKTKEAARKLQQDFLKHKVYKEYLCITEGSFTEEIHAVGYLCSDTSGPVRKKRKFIPETESGQKPPPDSETADTLLIPDKIYSGPSGEDTVSSVRCILKTGRMHQIRATLCSLGFPVTGDRLYGPDSSLYIKFIEDRETEEDLRRLRTGRTALHSRVLQFRHPDSGEEMRFEAPLPADITDFLNNFTAGS